MPPSVEVIDNLTTDDATKALSARQGKELFQSGVDRKNQAIVNINSMGGNVDDSMNFSSVLDEILKIETKSILTGNATPSQVLVGSKFYKDNPDELLVGTMPNNFGITDGTIAMIGATKLGVRPKKGYYSGDSGNYVEVVSEDWREENILSGKFIFGKAGSASTGKKFASGTLGVSVGRTDYHTSDGGVHALLNAVVTVLSFKPTGIILLCRTEYGYATTYYNPSGLAVSIIVMSPTSTLTIKNTSPVIISSTRFTLPVNRVGAYDWIAFE